MANNNKIGNDLDAINRYYDNMSSDWKPLLTINRNIAEMNPNMTNEEIRKEKIRVQASLDDLVRENTCFQLASQASGEGA